MFLLEAVVFIIGKLKVIQAVPVWKMNNRGKNKTKQDVLTLSPWVCSTSDGLPVETLAKEPVTGCSEVQSDPKGNIPTPGPKV